MKKILISLIFIIFSIFVISCDYNDFFHTHEYSELVDKVDATCTTSGHIAYYTCSGCDKYFDENKNVVETIIIEPLGHLLKEDATASDYIVDDTYHSLNCTRPGCNHTAKNNHIKGNKVVENVIEATKTSNGSHDEVYYCTVCNYEISRFTYTDHYIDSDHVHNYGTLHEQVDATCEHTGTIAYYYCSECKTYFDSNKTKVNDLTIPKKDHVLQSSYSGDYIVYSCKNCTYSYQESKVKTVNIYGINDYHGSVNSSNYIPVVKLGSYFKELKNEPNTLIMDQGDTWQGSLESNYNHGSLITDIYNYAGVDIRTVGNHDFDWGIDALKYNAALNYNGFKTTFLASNVYDYNFSTKTFGNTQQKEVGDEYKIIETENGVRIGVIGVIGYNQITSISTQLVQNIGFKNHIDIIKSLSDFLRVDKECDVIVCSVHCDQDEVLNTGLTDTSNYSSKRYVDVVLCAHSHQQEVTYENGAVFAQGLGYGGSINNITIKYNSQTKTVSISNTVIYAENINCTIDAEVQRIANTYFSETSSIGSEILAENVQTQFTASTALANLMCKAIYDEAVAEGYDVDFAYCNTARKSLYSGTWDYSDIYNAFPFDNTVYIIEISGSEVLKQIKGYNNIYRSSTTNVINGVVKTKKYKIACLDYLAYHTNSNRSYDYFPGLTNIGYLKKNNVIYNYRDIVCDYLRNLKANNVRLNSSDYTGGYSYDRSQITETTSQSQPTGYSTGKLDYLDFEVDTTSTTVRVNNSFNVTFTHSTIEDKSNYSEFGLPAYGTISFSAPTGYYISGFEIKQYNTSSNLSFKTNSTTFNVDTTTGTKYCIYSYEGNLSNLTITNTYSKTCILYYIEVYFAEK